MAKSKDVITQIKKATQRRFSADEKIRIVSEGLRGEASISEICRREGIAADLTKYPSQAFILFVIYDPQHMILSDQTFRADIESKGRNRILIIR